MRQKGILLRLIEAMNLIDEENGSLAVNRLALLRCLDDGPQLRNTPCDRREGHELRLRVARDEMRQCRLARTGRPPENDGGELICLDRTPQRPIRCSDVLLPDKVRKLSRPQTFGQRNLKGFLCLRNTK